MTTRPAEHDFIASFARAHEAAGEDAACAYDLYMRTGYVLKTPILFILAGHDHARPDAWNVWWAELHPLVAGDPKVLLRETLKLMPYRKPYIGWARGLRGRRTVKYYSTSRLLALSRH